MNLFSITATQSTPSIYFDPTEGKLEIKGRSIPENSVAFYQPLFDSLNEYVKNPVTGIKVVIQLEYYNSSSSVCLLNLLKKLEIFKDKLPSISIEWYYEEEDEDSLNAGNNLRSIIRLPIEVIKIKGK